MYNTEEGGEKGGGCVCVCQQSCLRWREWEHYPLDFRGNLAVHIGHIEKHSLLGIVGSRVGHIDRNTQDVRGSDGLGGELQENRFEITPNNQRVPPNKTCLECRVRESRVAKTVAKLPLEPTLLGNFVVVLKRRGARGQRVGEGELSARVHESKYDFRDRLTTLNGGKVS